MSFQKYRTIIWDWNGTLLNDVDFCLDIVNGILNEQDLGPLDSDTYRNAFGFPIVDYYKSIGFDFSKVSYDELTQIFMGQYESGVRDCNLHTNAVQTLEAFQGTGVKQFILTAAHKRSVQELSGHFEINSYFEHIEGLDNHRGDSKVQRGVTLMNEYNVGNNAVLIGDTDHDFEVAQHLGIDCILVANGHQSRKRLESHTSGRVPILNDITDLSDRI